MRPFLNPIQPLREARCLLTAAAWAATSADYQAGYLAGIAAAKDSGGTVRLLSSDGVHLAKVGG